MKRKLKVVFMSGTETGCDYIKDLNKLGYIELALVVTGMDRPVGRGQKVKKPPVAKYCNEDNVKVFQTGSINSENSIDKLRSINADLAIIVDFGQILSREVFDIFPVGSFNMHYSILPDLRGPEPIRWALLRGYKETGVSLIKIDEKIDTGKIAGIKAVRIEEDDDYESLKTKLTEQGKELLGKFLLELHEGNRPVFSPQTEHSDIIYAKKLGEELRRINWSLNSEEIINQIKALGTDPGCYAIYKKRNLRVKIVMAKESKVYNNIPGSVAEVTKDDFTISARSSGVKILKVQPAGKRIMKTKEFLAGNPVKIGDIFG
jgi:methionyl-tRNA formyltransferase